MLFFNNLLPATCIPYLITKQPTNIENKTIQFSTAVSYSPSGLIGAFKKKSKEHSNSFEPVYMSLIDSMALELEDISDFKKYFLEEFDHGSFDFVPKKNESWIKLLGTSFKAFTESHFEEAVDMIEKVILPYYPILTDSLAEFVIFQHLRNISEAEDNIDDIPNVLNKEVLRVFHDKLEHLFETFSGNYAETAKTFRSILWNARRSMKTSKSSSFRYHYAFLLNVPFKDMITIQLPGIEGFSHVSEYIEILAESVYDQLPSETAKIALGLVLPNVYDSIDEDKSYREVIKTYSQHQERIVDTTDFVQRLEYFIKTFGSNGFENISNEQGSLLMTLTSGPTSPQPLLQFAAKNFLYPPHLSVNSQVAYWKALTFSLMIRFSALFPEEAFKYDLPTVPNLANDVKAKYLGVSAGSVLDMQFYAKFGFTEAFKHCFDEFVAANKKEPVIPIFIPEGNAGESLAKQIFEATRNGSLLAKYKQTTFDVVIDNSTIDPYPFERIEYDYSGIYDIVYNKDIEQEYSNPIRDITVTDVNVEEKQSELSFIPSDSSSSTTEKKEDFIDEIIFYAVHFGRRTINRIILTEFDSHKEINYGKAILTAVRNKRFCIAKSLFEKAKDIKKSDIEMILGEVVKIGNFEMFEFIIEKDFAIDPLIVPDLIVLAAVNGSLDIIKYYLDSKPERIGNEPRIFCIREAFEVAVINNHLDIVKYLDEFLREEIYDFGPALETTARKGHLVMLEYFLDTKDFDEKVIKEVIIEAAKYDNYKVIEVIVEKNRNYSKGFGEALIKASALGKFKTVKYLINTFPLIHGSDIRDAFRAAVRCSNHDIIQLLLKVHEDEFNDEILKEANEELISNHLISS